MSVEKDRWAEEIADYIKDCLGMSVYDAVPIDKGWLNVKWKMETDRGPIFVKYYHPDRYGLHQHPERKRAIQKTLELQHGLNRSGVKCPGVYRHQNHFLHETSTGLYFAALDWVDGHTVSAGCLSVDQMLELGQSTGKMHKWLQAVHPLDKPAWQPDKAAYLHEWQINWEKAKETRDEIVLEWLTRSRDFVTSLDFRIFDPCRAGWLHWDLWVDNIVVKEQGGLAGIVDFDRMTMAYQEIDVARAILSGSLRNGDLQIDTVQSFIQGYRELLEFPVGTLLRAMGMIYLIESIWWLRTEVRAESNLRGLLKRFIEEVHWIEDSWDELHDKLSYL